MLQIARVYSSFKNSFERVIAWLLSLTGHSSSMHYKAVGHSLFYYEFMMMMIIIIYSEKITRPGTILYYSNNALISDIT